MRNLDNGSLDFSDTLQLGRALFMYKQITQNLALKLLKSDVFAFRMKTIVTSFGCLRVKNRVLFQIASLLLA